jgi:hypothetical protein
MMVTIFSNIKDTSTPFYRDVNIVFERIRTGKYSELIGQIRKEKDKTQRNELKKGLPAICFSGTFQKRSDDAILEHSGLICLDFDGYKTKRDMLEFKESLKEDAYVMAAFVSPSGDGLKVIVKIPADKENHKRYFDALEKHFNVPEFDVTSKNISRVCYESYDPNIHINTESSVWEKMSEDESVPMDTRQIRTTIALKDENKIIDRLMKWWNKEYGLRAGARNNNVFILAAAFNDFGISKSLAEYVLLQMQSSDFPSSEIKVTIDSAYRNTSAHGTKFYEDETEVHRIKSKITSGASSREIKKDLLELDVREDDVDDIIKTIEKNLAVTKFWTVSDKGSVNIIHYMFKDFLQQNGFYKYAPHGSDKYMFVKVTNNLIDKASEEDVKDFVLGHLEKVEDLSIYNYFADKTRFFKEDFLSLLDTVSIHFVEDTIDMSFIYYRNCALKVTKTNVEQIDYVDLGGFVWRDQVIDRDYVSTDVADCDFKTFLSNVAGGDEKSIESFRSTIGFMMSGYKDPKFCPSVILNDEVITDNPEGGTGKGLFVQAISKLKKVSYIDGKAFSFEKQFAYQTVSTDTQVISFDDVKRGFFFERLFSVITEGITLEKKNKDAIKIPFKFSPKIVITTNYAISGKGNSFERRKWELEFRQHYRKEFTPADEFGRRLFDDWDEHEWMLFDNYMISNLQFYLNNGLVKSEFKNLGIRKLASQTAHEFIEWLGLVEGTKPTDVLIYDKKIFKDDLYNDFITDNPDFAPKAKMTISRTNFYKWLLAFASYKKGIEAVEGRDTLGRWIIFKTQEDETKVPVDDGFVF